MENNRRVRETVYGREYTISAELTQPNGTYGIKVKNCFAFNKKNDSYPLINEKGFEDNGKNYIFLFNNKYLLAIGVPSIHS